MKTQELLNLEWDDISSMNTKELRKNTRQLVDIINKRAKTYLSKKGIDFNDSISINELPNNMSLPNWIKEYGVNPSLKDMGVNDLRNVFSNASKVLSNKTGSVRGINKVIKEQAKRLGIKTKDLDNFWKIYNRFSDEFPVEMYTYDSSQIQNIISESNVNDDSYDNLESIRDALNERNDIRRKMLAQEEGDLFSF